MHVSIIVFLRFRARNSSTGLSRGFKYLYSINTSSLLQQRFTYLGLDLLTKEV